MNDLFSSILQQPTVIASLVAALLILVLAGVLAVLPRLRAGRKPKDDRALTRRELEAAEVTQIAEEVFSIELDELDLDVDEEIEPPPVVSSPEPEEDERQKRDVEVITAVGEQTEDEKAEYGEVELAEAAEEESDASDDEPGDDDLEETAFNDVFEDDFVVDPYFQALCDDLPEIPLEELVLKSQDTANQLREWNFAHHQAKTTPEEPDQ